MRIYLDHNATTPLHPAVVQAQMQAMETAWANASSLHADGRAAKQGLEAARKQVAGLLGALPEEIVFSSGGTESNHMAILGACRAWTQRGNKPQQIVTSPLEHPSVLAAVKTLVQEGWSVHWTRVGEQGGLDEADFVQALAQKPTRLATLALCNHELGNVYPVAKLAGLAHQHGALVHCDAVQAAGRIPVQVKELEVDFLSCSAHKMYGPKGAGALWASARLPADALVPWLQGGQQEKGRRAGTENSIALVGFGVACALAAQELDSRMQQTANLRNQLEQKLLSIPGTTLHGFADTTKRNPGTCNIGFAGVPGDVLMSSLDLRGVSVSVGAACSSGSMEPSPVLLALGLSKKQALQAVRFSVGYENTPDQINQVFNLVQESVVHIRTLSE